MRGVVRLVPLAANLALGAAPVAQEQARRPEVTTLQLPANCSLADAVRVDVDGDGLDDLVLIAREPRTDRRELRLHRGRAATPPFPGEPSAPPYAVERDVVAFAFADVDPARGRELVLFTAERAVAVLSQADGAPHYVPLFTHRLVWPAPDRERVLSLQFAVADVDGDGRDDFVLPEADGVRVLLQRPGDPPFVLAGTWTLPPTHSGIPTAGSGPLRLGAGELQLRLGDEDAGRDDLGPLLSLRARGPFVLQQDLDGDGRTDLCAMRNGALWRWRQDPAGTFPAAPVQVPLPLPPDRLQLFDPAFDVQLRDLDGDGIADLLLTTSARRDDDVEVRIDRFTGTAAGTFADSADGRLRLQSLAAPPQLVDVDGDGRLDLCAITLRVDLLASVTGGGTPSADAQLNVFRNDGRRFVTPALAAQQLQLLAGPGSPRTPFVRLVAAAGGGAELLLRHGDELLLRPLTGDATRLRLGEPRWRLPLREGTALRFLQGARPAVLAIEAHELLHVRWR